MTDAIVTPEQRSDTNAQLIGPALPPRAGVDQLFGGVWPEVAGRVPARPRSVLAAGLVSLSGAVLLPGQPAGLGWWVIAMAGAAVVGFPRRLRPDAAAALGRAHTVTGMLVSGLVMPLSWLRGASWLRRSIVPRPGRQSLPLLRTAGVSGGLLLVLGALLASADAVFAGWLTIVLPTLPDEGLGEPLTIFAVLSALILGGVYVALNPPHVERAALRPARPVRRYEWLIPVGCVAGLLTVFLLAQLSALFGGHAYLRATTGLTYAEYARQGFGQLTAATVIVLIVVAVVLRRAPRRTMADRAVLRSGLGLLCGLTLVVVASALHRLGLYQEAYGFTRLRLLVMVVELWLGLVLLLAMTAGVWLRARWIPTVAVLSGVLALLGLAAANPDAVVARHNVERLQATGQIDWVYLRELSDDAVPAISALPEPYRSCALGDREPARDSLRAWNLGRARAAAVLAERPPSPVDCSAVPRR